MLDEIRLGRSRSRSELVARTGLGRAIVAQRVGELIERGLVVEGDVGPSTGGRPPRQLPFRADAGHVLVADLGATSIDVAVTDARRPDPRPPRRAGRRSRPGRSAASTASTSCSTSCCATTHAIPGPAVGRSASACPGPVEFATGRPISPPIMPGWDGYPIRERFAARYGAPVWVDNDVNVLALGEWRSGVAAGHDNVVVVKIGTGIGAGIISDGRLHRGAQGSAGDVGHIQVVDDPAVVCRCGNIGCLEALAGGAALGRDGEAAARDGRSARLRTALDQRGAVTAEDVARAASFGDPVAVALLQAAGRRVGSMLASVVNFFNPSLIVIGGGVAQQPGPAAGGDPRDGLPAVAAARDARAAHPALVARRAGRRHRRVGDGRRPALRARRDRPLDRGRRAVGRAGGLARSRLSRVTLAGRPSCRPSAGVLIDWNPRYLYRRIGAIGVERARGPSKRRSGAFPRSRSVALATGRNADLDAGRTVAGGGRCACRQSTRTGGDLDRRLRRTLGWRPSRRDSIERTVEILAELRAAGRAARLPRATGPRRSSRSRRPGTRSSMVRDDRDLRRGRRQQARSADLRTLLERTGLAPSRACSSTTRPPTSGPAADLGMTRDPIRRPRLRSGPASPRSGCSRRQLAATTRSLKSPEAGSLRISFCRPSGRISRLMTTWPS